MNNTAPANLNDPMNGHPIKVVVQRTGLSAHVIRIWEKRYNAIIPQRTNSNRRLYTTQDIDRLKLLKQAIQAGRSIGQIAHLTSDQLNDLVRQDRLSQQPDDVHVVHHNNKAYQEYIDDAIKATAQLDAQILFSILSRATVAFSQPALIEHVVVPLMYQIGDLWQKGTLRVAHEHLAYAVIRSFLENLKTSYAISPSAPHIVVATPSGQLHELGAIIVSTIASSEGWQVTYLGASLPAEEIISTAQQINARAVALSLVYPEDDPQLIHELNKLRDHLPKNVALLIGGRVAKAYHAVIEKIGAIQIGDLNDLRDQLRKQRTHTSV